MRRTAAALTGLMILAACGGPEEPPNPESAPLVEEPGYEAGMTTGETGEVIDAEGRLEEYADTTAR